MEKPNREDNEKILVVGDYYRYQKTQDELACLPLGSYSEEGSDCELVDPKRYVKRVLDIGCCYQYQKTQDESCLPLDSL